jgi:hypothetical protein
MPRWPRPEGSDAGRAALKVETPIDAITEQFRGYAEAGFRAPRAARCVQPARPQFCAVLGGMPPGTEPWTGIAPACSQHRACPRAPHVYSAPSGDSLRRVNHLAGAQTGATSRPVTIEIGNDRHNLPSDEGVAVLQMNEIVANFGDDVMARRETAMRSRCSVQSAFTFAP